MLTTSDDRYIISYEYPQGRIKVDLMSEWLEQHIGEEDDAWTWLGYEIKFMKNTAPEDLVAFKLAFNI